MKPAVFFISLLLLLIAGTKPVQQSVHTPGMAKTQRFTGKSSFVKQLSSGDQEDISVLSDDLEDDDELVDPSSRKLETVSAFFLVSALTIDPASSQEYNKPLARFSGTLSPVYIFQRVMRI